MKRALVGIVGLAVAAIGLAALVGPVNLARLGVADPASRIDFRDVLPSAERAAAAYGDDDAIRRAYGAEVVISTTRGTGVKYFLETDAPRSTQWVVVRGTDDLANVKVDSSLSEKPDERLGIRLHHGFQRVALEIYPEVRPLLRPGYTIHLTGHSLGAAVTAILQAWLEKEGLAVAPGYNFGQPKITNVDGAQRLADLRLLRVVNQEDPIPLLPPRLMQFRGHVYDHCGAEAVLETPPRFLFLDRHDADRLAVSDFWRNLGHESIAAHHSGLYLDKVRALAAVVAP